mmetsp:Transcript_10485/g.17144  ORF Transcript_10485/g.17144 Transcript_10485/m.17144 type:complete len:113 (+) Transcript_10485:1150-1488(+)
MEEDLHPRPGLYQEKIGHRPLPGPSREKIGIERRNLIRTTDYHREELGQEDNLLVMTKHGGVGITATHSNCQTYQQILRGGEMGERFPLRPQRKPYLQENLRILRKKRKLSS